MSSYEQLRVQSLLEGFEKKTGWEQCAFAITMYFATASTAFGFLLSVSSLSRCRRSSNGKYDGRTGNLPLPLPLPFSFPKEKEACTLALHQLCVYFGVKIVLPRVGKKRNCVQVAASNIVTSSRATYEENGSLSSPSQSRASSPMSLPGSAGSLCA